MNLQEIRVTKGFTQQTVADAIGCSLTTYSRYERGERIPDCNSLILLSKFFNESIDYIVGNGLGSTSSLSLYEQNLVTAARNTDERAREDALSLLLSHAINKKSN